MSEKILYEKRGEVACVTINRPEVLNALDLESHEYLSKVWGDFERDRRLKVAVLSGTGGKAFSVGQDLKELDLSNEKSSELTSFGQPKGASELRLTQRFDVTKPIIAKVDGYAMGGGFELALACDIIVATEKSVFALPEAKLGLIPGAGGVFRLSRYMPMKLAMGYLITGRRMSAEEANRFGLINQLTASVEDLDTAVDCWVEDIISCSSFSVRSIKDAISRSYHCSIEKAFKYDYPMEAQRLNSQDPIEGPRAFKEKRKPSWSN